MLNEIKVLEEVYQWNCIIYIRFFRSVDLDSFSYYENRLKKKWIQKMKTKKKKVQI